MSPRRSVTSFLALLLVLLVGCGGGGSLVGNEDSTAVIAFDVPLMDAGRVRDVPEESYSDILDRVDIPLDVPVTNCIDQDHDGFGGPGSRGDCPRD